MKKIYAVCLLLLTNLVFPQTRALVASSCDNEDFELSLSGVVTSSTGVAGWTVNRLFSNPSVCNATVLSSTLVTTGDPDAGYIELFNAPGGIIDPLIGNTYTVYSVFGAAPNGGEALNPGITKMYGDRFVRVNNSGTVHTHHAIEKTFTVTASNSLFRFAYLPVISPSSGGCCAQPGVYSQFFNASGGNTLLPCPSYTAVAPTAICLAPYAPNMSICPADPNSWYHTWIVHAVDLTPYMGNTITFKMGALYCQNGCAHHGYAYLDAQCSPMQILVNGNPIPAQTNTVTFQSCGGNTATVVVPPDFYGYSWTGPGGFTSTLSAVTLTTAGMYTLNIKSGTTCSDIIKYVDIKLHPAPTLSAVANTTMSCAGNPVTLTLSGLATYSVNGNPSPGIAIVKPTVTTIYSISAVDANGCSDAGTVTVTVDQCAGINNGIMSYDIHLRPNPNNGNLLVTGIENCDGCEIEVFNQLGERLFNGPLSGETIQTGLADGIYVYRISEDTRTVITGRFIVIK